MVIDKIEFNDLMSHRLIIMRGNSGSGKTTTAYQLREALITKQKTALIEQDHVRRIMLKEKDVKNGDNIDLIRHIVLFSFDRGYDVILEGILSREKYGDMLHELMMCAKRSFVYYFDIPFAETVRRHQKKIAMHEFGEAEMRMWYLEKDLLGVENEKIISQDASQQKVIARIVQDTVEV